VRVGALLSAVVIVLWLGSLLMPEHTRDPQQVPLGKFFGSILALAVLALIWVGVFVGAAVRSGARAAKELRAGKGGSAFHGD
jgi:hypothetical protein